MRILVTGANGFFGVNIVRELAGVPGLEALLAADLGPPDAAVRAFLAPAVAHVEHTLLDVCDRAAVRTLVSDSGATHIVHAAALTPDAEQERAAPTRVVDVNLGGTVNVLDAALAAPRVARSLLLSSSAVYGAPPPGHAGAQGEDGPLLLGSMYAATKRAVELLMARYATSGRVELAAIRPAALYGPMERPTGSRARMSVAYQLREALRAGRVVTVAGPDVSCDWTYVSDAAAAVRGLLTAPRWSHDLYNLSCGRSARFRDVVAAFTAAGLRASWVEDQTAADVVMRPEQERAPLDITLIQADAGYQPRFDITSGIAAYLAQEHEPWATDSASTSAAPSPISS